MPKLVTMIISCIYFLFVLVFPCLAPTTASSAVTNDSDKIIADIVADFSLLSSLYQDVSPFQQYYLTLHATSPDTAKAYLSAGYTPDLAEAICECYLQWLPAIGKMAVIPTESVPLITDADRSYLKLRHTSPDEVIIERIYTDCYTPGDRYLYSITAQYVKSRWIISGMQLDPL
jgi:hypothetical protein